MQRWKYGAPLALLLGLTSGCGGESASGELGPDAGTAGTVPDASGVGETSSVVVIRGAQGDEFWDLTLRGVGLGEYEGKKVHVRMGWPDRPPERLGWGEAPIVDGAFELVFPAVWETSLYKTKLALIDVNGDGACDLSADRLFEDSRATKADVLTVTTGPRTGQSDMFEGSEGSEDYYCAWFNAPWPSE